jgi:predicted alpha/beta hydrolase family esterase
MNFKSKIKILLIHGGMTFYSRKDYLNFLKSRKVFPDKKISWSGEYLEKNLGPEYIVIRPRMPLQDNAKYAEWKIHFEKYLKLIENNFILIGNSLGGIFLAKYLSENQLNKKPISTFLICAPFDDSLTNEDLAGGFKLKSNLSLIQKNTRNLYLLFSKDDDVVPVSHAKKYAKKLKGSQIIIYKNKNGHFNIPKFPEIIKMIKKDIKNKPLS